MVTGFRERRPSGTRLSPAAAAWTVLALLTSGCSGALGPEHLPTTRVSGSVVEGGRPVTGGWIEFIPVEGTVGNLRSARLGSDGSFKADRVAVGENAIRLVNARIEIPGGAALFGAFTTPIRRLIPQSPEKPLKIDLIDEAIRYRSTRAAAADRPSQEAEATR